MADERRRRPSESKNWLFTPHCANFVGRDDQWYFDTLMAKDCVQAVAGQRETCPTTGAEHMQLFVRLTTRKRETAVVRQQLLGASADVKIGDGKWEAMKAYCTREYYADDHPEYPGCRKRMENHEAIETGIWPQRRGTRNDLLNMVDFAIEDKGESK